MRADNRKRAVAQLSIPAPAPPLLLLDPTDAATCRCAAYDPRAPHPSSDPAAKLIPA
jgi:hypothetical protein